MVVKALDGWGYILCVSWDQIQGRQIIPTTLPRISPQNAQEFKMNKRIYLYKLQYVASYTQGERPLY